MSDQRSPVNQRRLSRAADLHEAGQHARAASICSRILRSEPGNTDALCLMAVIRFERGERNDALDMLTHARAGDPGNARLVVTLADLLLFSGDVTAAIAILREALSVQSGLHEFEIRLADALRIKGDARQSVELYRKVLEDRPGHIGARLSLAEALRTLGEIDEAVTELEHALGLEPDDPHAAGALAELYEQLNRVEDARRLAVAMLDRWPRDLRLSLVAARCLRRSGQPDEALTLLDGMQLHGANARDRADYHYERGFLLDRLMRPEAAMEAFSEANSIAERIWLQDNPGENAYAHKTRRLRTSFTPELVTGWEQVSCPSEERCPVFLVGFPRSGTTLLDQVLDSHPATQVIEERGLVAVLEHELSMQGPFPGVLADLEEEQLEALRERYYALARSETALQPGRLLIDKLPLNITNAGLIFRVFPNARFVFALRHPADVCLSCYMQNFRPTDAMANFFSLASTVDFYASVMALWRTYRDCLPLSVHTVRYEDLLEDFRSEAEELLRFLGLDWNESVMAFHEHAQRRARINTPSYHQVSRPLYTDARFRWHRYRKQLEPFLPQLAPWIRAFGYEEQDS